MDNILWEKKEGGVYDNSLINVIYKFVKLSFRFSFVDWFIILIIIII